MSSEEPKKRGRPAQIRTVIVDISDLDLNTYEGQLTLLKRVQTILATSPNLNSLDLKILGMIEDTVKTRNNIEALNLFIQLKNEIDQLKKQQKETS